MKGKKLKLIDEIEWSELDFDLRDEVLGNDIVEQMYDDIDNRFTEHQRVQIAQLRKVDNNDIEKFIDNGKIITIVNGEEVTVSISEADRKNGSPKIGDMIARNPENHKDQWLVAKNYYLENFRML